ncbi:uncharacterized protein [Diabrotica undecimpunctata]|uniref:uncharacterized protein n=1 Tax=Diabrotica undecimpunctata TaxID=50387 RepID=UPI003B64280A
MCSPFPKFDCAACSRMHYGKYFFFLVAEEIYVFFSASTYRWKRLTDLLKNCGHTTFVPKRVNVTRWSGRFNALKALNLCCQDIKQALLELSANDDEKMPVRCQANNLHEKMATLEFGIYVAFWFEVLERTDLASKSLQSANMDLHTCSSLYSSLQHFYESLRDKCNLFEQKGQLLSQQTEYSKEIRSRKRKLQFDEADTEQNLTPQNKIRTQVLYKTIDYLANNLKSRGKVYEDLSITFSVLFSLPLSEDNVISDKASVLVNIYSNDLDTSLPSKCIQLKHFIMSLLAQVEYKNPTNHTKLLHKNNIIATFPNVEIALRIFLSLMVTNATGERSFSSLKRVKNYLRN